MVNHGDGNLPAQLFQHFQTLQNKKDSSGEFDSETVLCRGRVSGKISLRGWGLNVAFQNL